MDKEPQSWLVVVVVKVKPGKERQVIKIDNDGKSDGCEVNERNNARQPNRDKFQELDATGSGKEEKTDSSSYGTLQICGPSRKSKVHWGTRETQPPSSLPQQVGSASQQFAAYRLFLCIGPCCSSDRQAYRRPRGTLQFQYTDTSVNFVPQWECEHPRQSETAVESPDQSPPGLFNHLETPLGSTRTVQSRLSIHRNFSFPTTNILLLEQAPYNARSTLIYPCKAALSPILAKYDVGSYIIAFRGCAQKTGKVSWKLIMQERASICSRIRATVLHKRAVYVSCDGGEIDATGRVIHLEKNHG
jgi:hypothetical protein